MRYILITALFVTTTALAQNIDVQHYKFNIRLNNENDTVYASAIITIKFLAPVSSFNLQLAGENATRQQMIIDGLDVAAGSEQEIRNYERKNDIVTIVLEKPVMAGSELNVVLSYHGVPKDGLIISKNKYGERTFFADNWPDRAHNWIPCVDDPADKASFEFLVTAPAQYQVISNGKLVEEKIVQDSNKLSHWKEDVPLSTKIMVIGAARFAVKTYADSPKDIPVSAWVYPQDSAKGFQNYSHAPEILKFYSNYIGTYPYEKLANVQSKTIFGGMENASAIFYAEGSASSKQPVEDLLAHEIAHQWFGDMVTEKKYSHLWLSEGFATYMTDMYLESKYGGAMVRNRLKKERDDVISFNNGHPVVDSISKGMSLLNPNSYQKGGWVLHMLRHQVGDSVFNRTIRTYYERFKGKNADTKDFEKLAEEKSKKDLRRFFKQWLYTAGIPQLQIKWKVNKNIASITVTQTQKELFQFPLEVFLSSNSRNGRNVTIAVSKKTETFILKSPELIKHVEIDPGVCLLFEQK